MPTNQHRSVYENHTDSRLSPVAGHSESTSCTRRTQQTAFPSRCSPGATRSDKPLRRHAPLAPQIHSFHQAVNRRAASAFRRCRGGALRRAGIALGAMLLVQGSVLPAQSAETEDGATVEATAAMESATGHVNINNATTEELASGLVGIGLSKADAIVRYREQFGPFESVDELSEVKGVGAGTVDRNRARIRLE